MKKALIQSLPSDNKHPGKYYSDKVYKTVQKWIDHPVLKMEYLVEDYNEVLELIEKYREKKIA